MPKGIPAAGFRRTKKRMMGVVPGRRGPGRPPKADSFPVVNQEVPVTRGETVSEIVQKLTDRFHALEVMAEATGRGLNRALIVSGPAGLGKSFTVEAIMARLEKEGHGIQYIKGYVRPLALYRLLYNARHKNSVLIFDDSDSLFADDVSMNLLKGACDSTEKRVLHWLSESVGRLEDSEGDSIPEKFEFEGSVIFITNYDFDLMIERGTKLAPHFEALVSRSHYLDLEMKSKMDYVVRIRQVVSAGMLRDRGFSSTDEKTLLDFIEKNMNNLRELSLRMVIKLSTLMQMDRANWMKLAAQTCMRNK